MTDSSSEFHDTPKWPLRIAALGLLLLTLIGLVSCTSPEGKLKKRQETMEKFVTQVTTRLFDKNPETVNQSMTLLLREDLSDSVREKLQRAKLLPNTELGVLKIVTEAEESRTTNKVDVAATKALGPVDKEVVPFQVNGKVTTKTAGKPDQVAPIDIRIVVKLPIVAGAWPEVIDITGMSPDEKKKPEKQDKPGKKKKKRRNR